ncbi:MAG: hypothetical protein HY823_11105 [Acidobacteria bacterium]|nr:hypothetical protein [Acidobacteriota bacterium]
MCRTAALLLALSLGAAEPQGPDRGRLDPAWFGSGVVFQESQDLGHHWVRPGLNLNGRSLRILPWEAPAWVAGPRDEKDRRFVRRLEGTFEAQLESALRKQLQGCEVSSRAGAFQLAGRVADAAGPGDEGSAVERLHLTVDLKLTDPATGDLLAAFHHSVRGLSDSAWQTNFGRWCDEVGRALAAEGTKAAPVRAPVQAPSTGSPALRSPEPGKVGVAVRDPKPFDLPGTLARLERLRADGILTEAEHRELRKRAEEKAREK